MCRLDASSRYSAVEFESLDEMKQEYEGSAALWEAGLRVFPVDGVCKWKRTRRAQHRTLLRIF